MERDTKANIIYYNNGLGKILNINNKFNVKLKKSINNLKRSDELANEKLLLWEAGDMCDSLDACGYDSERCKRYNLCCHQCLANYAAEKYGKQGR